MKKLISVSVLFLIMTSFSGIKAMAGTHEKHLVLSPGDEKIEVYYFHYTRRCATCNAVEDETKKALEEHFKKQMDDGTITFLSVNIEEDSNATLVDLYKISGQTLLFVSGDKTVDLTDKAFMNARTKPEKFRKLVKETVIDLEE